MNKLNTTSNYIPAQQKQLQLIYLPKFIYPQLLSSIFFCRSMITIQEYPTLNSQADSKKTTQLQIKSNQNLSYQNPYQHNFKSIYLKGSDTKLFKVIEKKQTNLKKSLPVKEFQYGSKNPHIQKRSHSEAQLTNAFQIESLNQRLYIDPMPIKIIKDKIEHEENAKTQNLKSKKHSIQQSKFQVNPLLNPQKNKKQIQKGVLFMSTVPNFRKMAFKQQFQLKEKQYKPKLSIFQRYNYENYENYRYTSPFKKHQSHSVVKKNEGSDRYRFPTSEKYQPNKGSAKNLQIIFCETKYPDFVGKSNEFYQKSTQSQVETRSKLFLLSKNHSSWQVEPNLHDENSLKNMKKSLIQTINAQSRKLFNKKNITKWSYSPIKTEPQRNNNTRYKNLKTKLFTNQNISLKSTLEKLLQQFKSLEKLSQFNQKQQQSNINYRKQKQNTVQDYSRTVLINLIVDKFPFLENLGRSFRNYLLKTVFEFDNINQSSKISIHDYLKFNRIFVSRDSPVEELSGFLLSLMFKNSSTPTFETAEKVLNQLNPKNKRKLQTAIETLFLICEIPQIRYQALMKKFTENSPWINSIIDLIKDQ